MDGYHTPYRAESYELAHTRLPWLNKDAPIYWAAYKEMRLLRPLDKSKSDGYTVVDIGTGTGRVIRNITASLIKEATSLDETRFIGLDTSSHMLLLAIQAIPGSLVPKISYHLASAMDMQTIETLKGPLTVDLLIFAKGYVAALHKPGEAERFLRMVSSVLRPGSGRALFSLFNMSEESSTASKGYTYEESSDLPCVEETASVIYPNLVYRQSKSDVRREGNAHVIKSTFEVVEKGQNNEEKVVESDTSVVNCRIWKKGEFVQVAAEAGLTFVEMKASDDEIVYVFRT